MIDTTSTVNIFNSAGSQMSCRVCGGDNVRVLPIGRYAEFFRMKVDTEKDPFLLFSRADSIRVSSTPRPVRALKRIAKLLRTKVRPAIQFRTYMQACMTCDAITPCHEYSFEDLLGLYRDYRTETYNRDRISVEPSYSRIAKDVGSHALEIKNRNFAVDAFLGKNVRHFAGGAMIDYGGSDGRFISSFAYKQFERIHIYDASSAPLHVSVDPQKVERVKDPDPETYSFLTCMHVLEHVGNPRVMVTEAARLLVPGGLMYLEVPLDLTESIRGDFRRRIIDSPILVHEHINTFGRESIRALVRSIVGLELIDDAEDVVDLGWVRGQLGRFLARKVK